MMVLEEEEEEEMVPLVITVTHLIMGVAQPEAEETEVDILHQVSQMI
jgi:hypothetical protein